VSDSIVVPSGHSINNVDELSPALLDSTQNSEKPASGDGAVTLILKKKDNRKNHYFDKNMICSCSRRKSLHCCIVCDKGILCSTAWPQIADIRALIYIIIVLRGIVIHLTF
jgi:hypothetical protein